MAFNNYKRCSVKSCTSSSSIRNLSFFGYPKDIERREIWMKNCHTEHLTNNLSKSNNNYNNYRVCEKHFEDQMFLNSTTKCRLVFNAIPTLFNFDVKEDPLTNVSTSHISCASLSSSFSSNVVSAESIASTLTVDSSDSSNQTPGYLSANTTRKKKMLVINKYNIKEISRINKAVLNLSEKLANNDTVENYVELSKKYLSLGLFTIVKNHLNLKNKNKHGYRYNNDIKQLALNIYFLGPRDYKLLLNIFSLPSIPTLKRVTTKFELI